MHGALQCSFLKLNVVAHLRGSKHFTGVLCMISEAKIYQDNVLHFSIAWPTEVKCIRKSTTGKRILSSGKDIQEGHPVY